MAGATRASRASATTSASTSARPSSSRSRRTPRTTESTSTAWAGTEDSGRASSTPSRRRCRSPSPSPRACAIPRRASTAAGTGRIRVLDGAEGRGLRDLLRAPRSPGPGAGAGPWRADHSLTPPAACPEAVAHAYGSLGHGRLRIALREPRASHIYFVVRDDASRSDILFQTADTTWQAYNRYGGHCTYGRSTAWRVFVR